MVARRNTRADGRLGDAAPASAELALALGDAGTVVAARIAGAEAQLFRCPTVAGVDASGQVVAASVGTSGFVDGLDRTRAWDVDGRRLRTEDVAAGFVLSVVASVVDLYGLPHDTTVTVLHPASLSAGAVEALRDGLDHAGFVGALRAAASVHPEIAARSELTPQPRLDPTVRRRRRAPAPTRAAVLAAAGALVVLVGGATAASHLDGARDVEPATSRDVVPPAGSATTADATSGDETTGTSTAPVPAAPENAPVPDEPDRAPEAAEPTSPGVAAVPTLAPAPGFTTVPVPPDGQWPPFSVPELPTLPNLPSLPEFPLPTGTAPAPSGSSAAPTTTAAPVTTTSPVTATP
ncbi:hypothetical protein [Rhodococcoides corynebacterioides]|uniref:hypothetical protein n=1 Tax=Rhodococcoides corynebacterioides TaxID=53972 RepID=UPI003ADD52E4